MRCAVCRTILWISGYVLLAMNPADAVYSGGCNSVDSISKSAYTHWPVGLDCDHLEKTWAEKENSTSMDEFDCEIWNGTIQLTTKIVEFSSMEESRSLEAKLVINGSFCISNAILVNVQPFPETKCEDFANDARAANEILHRQGTNGDTLELSCEHPNNTDVVIPAGMDRKQFDTKWMLGCVTDREETYRSMTQIHNEQRDDRYPDSLVYPRVDFYDAGELTCSVTYNGRTLYVVTKALCVKQKINSESNDRPSITCTKSYTVAKGETAHLDCDAIIPNGITSSNDFAVEWKKNGKVVCSTTVFNVNVESSAKHSCTVEGKNESLVCVEDGRSDDNLSYPPTKKITLEMRIRDLGPNDFGAYKVEIRHKGNMEPDNIELMEDLLPLYRTLVAVLTVALVLLTSGVVLAVLYSRNKLEIAIRCIKLKGRFNEQGEKAFLSYQYDRTRMSEAMEHTEQIVDAVDAATTCYDVQRESDVQSLQNILANSIANCHSVIMVLSPDYLKDEDMRFQADLAFNRLMTTRTRLIFVATGDIERDLRKAANDDEVWKNVCVAIKVFGMFVWTTGSEEQLGNYIAKKIPRRPHNVRFVPDREAIIITPDRL